MDFTIVINEDNNKKTPKPKKEVQKYDKRIELIKARGYPVSLINHIKINSKNVIMKLKNVDELEQILLIPDLRQSRFDSIEKDRNHVIIHAQLDKLRNRRDLLKIRGFPYLICPWAKINQDNIMLVFKSVDDFSFFLSIQNDILEYCKSMKSKQGDIEMNELKVKETVEKETKEK